MPIKTIEISTEGSIIKVRKNQLVIKKENKESKIPIDLLSIVLFTGYGQLISTKALEALVKQKCLIILCDRKFMPFSYLFPLALHHDHHRRVLAQMSLSEAKKKKLWKFIITQKVKGQAETLLKTICNDHGLASMATSITNGDPQNIEAKAARIYWSKLHQGNFRRSDDSHYFNGFLNYAYTILRSLTARNIVLNGLNPMFGIHHSNLENPYCLVDDLMEPFRPIVDFYLLQQDFIDDDLSPENKQIITSLSEYKVIMNGKRTPLNEAISTFISSYVSSLLLGKVPNIETFPQYKFAG